MHKILALSPKAIARRLGTLLFLGIAVHLVLPEIASLEHSWQVVLSMRQWAVALALAAQAVSYTGSGYLLQATVGLVRQRLSLWRSVLVVLGSASIGLVAGGTVGSSAATFRWTSEEGGSVESAALATLVPSLVNSLTIVLVSMFGLIRLLLAHALSQAQLISFGAMLATLAAAAVAAALALAHEAHATAILLRLGERVARLRRHTFDADSARKRIADLFGAWGAVRAGAWHRLALGSLVNVAFDMLPLLALFAAAGDRITVGVLLAGYGLPLLLGRMAFVIPGGVGVVESSMAALYSSLGIPSANAVIVVLGYRLISFWLPSLLGFPVAAYLSNAQGGRRRPRRPRTPPTQGHSASAGSASGCHERVL